MSDSLCVKDGRTLINLSFSELKYVESFHRYVKFVTTEEIYTVAGPLKNVVSRLPPDKFCRIHRKYIIAFRYARQYDKKFVQVGKQQFPVGRKYRGCLWAKLALILSSADMVETVVNTVV